MGDIHHWEHLPTNKRQLSGSNGVWLNTAYGEICFPSKNILTHLFQTVRCGGNAHLCLAKPEFMITSLITQHPRHHGCTSANKASGMLVKHLPPAPSPPREKGQVMQIMSIQPRTIHALPLDDHMHTAVPGPPSAGTLEGSRSG